jgi:N utilization substance protein B
MSKKKLLPKKKTLKDVTPMSDEELAKGIEDLSPFLHDAIKDRTEEIPRNVLEGLVQGADIPRRIMIKYQIPFNRHQQRQLAIEAVYHHLLMGKDIRRALYDVLLESNEVESFLLNLAVSAVDNEEEYISEIESSLRDDWSWDRLSMLEKSILLTSLAEIRDIKTPKAVVINEAVTLAKEYCDDSSPKLINGILDKVHE